MSHETPTPEERSAYIRERFAIEDPVLAGIGDAARAAGLPDIAVDAEVGRLLEMMTRAVGARRALEVGTLAGYSGIWIARGLVPGGQLVTLEADPAHADVARQHFAAANLGETSVDIRVGPALESLAAMDADGAFDLAFLDAAKVEYPAYLDHALRLVRPGGAILGDNTMLRGRVVRPDGSPEVDAMREFTRRLAEDPRIAASTILDQRDGLSISIVAG